MTDGVQCFHQLHLQAEKRLAKALVFRHELLLPALIVLDGVSLEVCVRPAARRVRSGEPR